jgi:tetratricopeptide (TPR) repeat protein
MSDFLRLSAYARLRSGDLEPALAEIDQAKKAAREIGSITRQISSLHLEGLARLEMDSPREAQAAAEKIRKLVEGWLNGKLIRYYDHLLGNIELKKGNSAKAIEYLEKAISVLDHQRGTDSFLDYNYGTDDEHALFYEPLAIAYLRSGELGRAQEQYEKIVRLTSARFFYGDIYARSFYMLGKIHEQKGERSRAAENYRKFLALGKDADPGLPEVEDARKRLAGLNL